MPVATKPGNEGEAMFRPGLFRVAVAVACVVYAVVALGNGLDHQATYDADLVGSVPAPFANNALEERVAAALSAGDWAGATRNATLLVSRNPIDPAPMGMLGAARDGAGDPKGADAAYRIARQMGWREELTQQYWLGRALAQGDYRGASTHVDAILRQWPDRVSDRDLLDAMERGEQGQQALAQRLVAKPDWLDTYMSNVWDVPRDILLLRARVLGRAAGLGVVGGCEPAGKIAYRLVDLGEARVAAQIWHDHCHEVGAGLVGDGNFTLATFAPTTTPFDWEFYSNSDVDVAFGPAVGGGKSLLINTSAPFTKPVAGQFIVVSAGAYRLSWASQGHAGADTPMVVASLDCDRRATNWLSASRDPRSLRWFADVVPGDACPGKWLKFAVRPGVKPGAGVSGGEVTLEAVRLEPIASRPATRPALAADR